MTSSLPSSGNPTSTSSSSSPTDDANAPFLGTPYVLDMQRPYEYPFPSPATESCPSLLLPYTHATNPHAHQYPTMDLPHMPSSSSSSYSSSSTTSSSSLTTSLSSFVHRTHGVEPHGTSHHHHNHHRREGSAGSHPYPPTILPSLSHPHSHSSAAGPPISFRPSTLLRRRSSSYREHGPTSTLVPVPPRLLARDLPLTSLTGAGAGAGSTVGNGARWKKGRRSGEGGGAPDK